MVLFSSDYKHCHFYSFVACKWWNPIQSPAQVVEGFKMGAGRHWSPRHPVTFQDTKGHSMFGPRGWDIYSECHLPVLPPGTTSQILTLLPSNYVKTSCGIPIFQESGVIDISKRYFDINLHNIIQYDQQLNVISYILNYTGHLDIFMLKIHKLQTSPNIM